MKKPRILVVTIKKWNIENFKKFKKKFEKKFKIYLISNKNKLNKKKLKKIEPNFIFFIHWSTKVSNQITSNFNCYNFTSIYLMVRGFSFTKFTFKRYRKN